MTHRPIGFQWNVYRTAFKTVSEQGGFSYHVVQLGAVEGSCEVGGERKRIIIRGTVRVTTSSNY